MMDWSQVKKVPKYNPMMFTLVRQLDGLTKFEFAKRAGISAKRLSDIEAGDVEATDDEVAVITRSQTHVIETFFMQWDKNEIEWKGYGGIQKPIDYYKFKIFRDANPPRMKVV